MPELHQWVLIDVLQRPDVPAALEDEPLEVIDRAGEGEDAFVQLQRENGAVLPTWFRSTELKPAPATVKPGKLPRVVAHEEIQMSDAQKQLQLRADVLVKKYGLSLGQALIKASHDSPDIAAVYLNEHRAGSDETLSAAPLPSAQELAS